MTGKGVFLLTLSLLFVGSLSRSDDLDCEELDLGDDPYDDDDRSTASPVTTPPPGVLPTAGPGDATVTATCPNLQGQSQCCSSSYFDNKKKQLKNQNMKNGLYMQAQPQLGPFHSLASDVYTYYMSTLNGDIAGNFANQVTPNDTTLNTNPAADRFNPSVAVLQTLGGLIRSLRNSNLALNKTCIDLQTQITITNNGPALTAFAKDLASIRNASTLFYFIDQYLQNITDTLYSMVPASDQCTNVLLKLTCSKCAKTIPRLCASLCSAAVKGCLAPYAAALNPQFNILWSVTSQLVKFLNTTLTDMFLQQNIIKQALINDLMTVCKVDFTSTLNVNVRPRGVGVGFLTKAQKLLNSGLLQYNGTSALLCSAKSQKSNCWDGLNTKSEDGSEFSKDTIKGQAGNPAGSFDEGELTQQAQMLGTPINTFFNSPNVSLVTPSAITIPQAQVYTGGAAALSTSLLLVLVLALLV